MRKSVSLIWVLILSLFLCACTQNNSVASWQEQYDLGVRYLSEGNYEEAIIAFTAAIEIDPKQADAYIGRGDAYIGSGEAEENLAAALADYQTVLGLDDTRADAYLGVADVYIRQGNFEKALEVLEQGLEKTGEQLLADKLEMMREGRFQDSNGNTRITTMYDGTGDLLFYHVFDYDAASRKQYARSYNPDGTETSYIEYAYNLSGSRIRGDSGYNPRTGEFYVGEYTYGVDDELLREDLYREGGVLWCYHTWEYNSAGQQVRWNEFSADGRLGCFFLYDYDQGNQLIRSTFYDADDNAIKYYYTHEYDNRGYETKRSTHDEHGVLSEYTVYDRDENGKILSTDTYDASGKLIQTTSYG